MKCCRLCSTSPWHSHSRAVVISCDIETGPRVKLTNLDTNQLTGMRLEPHAQQNVYRHTRLSGRRLKIAIISDIHGNLVALESILPGIKDVDRIVCLGDVAASGPQPHETISFLRRAGWPCVLGNTDETLAKGEHESFGNLKMPANERQKLGTLHDWTSSRIVAGDRKYLASFKPTIEIRVGRHSLLCYHGSPRSYTEQILPTTSNEELGKIFEGRHARAYAGGHTHSQMVRKFGASLIVNPGSVGLPFFEAADGKVMNPVWAEYGFLTTSGDDLRVELRRERYRKRDLKDSVMRSGMPDPEWWLRDWT